MVVGRIPNSRIRVGSAPGQNGRAVDDDITTTHEASMPRELEEETGLKGHIVAFLFTLPYELGTSTTFLVETEGDGQIRLGYDPEEAEEEHKMLEDVAWISITDVADHPEVQRVLACLR